MFDLPGPPEGPRVDLPGDDGGHSGSLTLAVCDCYDAVDIG